MLDYIATLNLAYKIICSTKRYINHHQNLSQQIQQINSAHGMMECTEQLLNKNRFLLIYGPFKVDGTFNSASDKQFNETLNSTGVPGWGLKDIAD